MKNKKKEKNKQNSASRLEYEIANELGINNISNQKQNNNKQQKNNK